MLKKTRLTYMVVGMNLIGLNVDYVATTRFAHLGNTGLMSFVSVLAWLVRALAR